MIIRGPIVPWELGAEKGRPVAAYYGYSIMSFILITLFFSDIVIKLDILPVEGCN